MIWAARPSRARCADRRRRCWRGADAAARLSGATASLELRRGTGRGYDLRYVSLYRESLGSGKGARRVVLFRAAFRSAFRQVFPALAPDAIWWR